MLLNGIDFIVVELQSKGSMDRHHAKKAAEDFRSIERSAKPNAGFAFMVGGFDSDPRELWHIEEARRFLQMWTRFAQVDTFESARRAFHYDYLAVAPDGQIMATKKDFFVNDSMVWLGILALCGAMQDVEVREFSTGPDGHMQFKLFRKAKRVRLN